MKTASSSLGRAAPALAPLLWLCGVLAGCTSNALPVITCSSDGDCPGGTVCASGNCARPAPDAAASPDATGDYPEDSPDFSVLPDLADPCGGGCCPGTRACVSQGTSHCIPDTSCCDDSDCKLAGQRCEIGTHVCTCPMGTRECLATTSCIPIANCCENADCPSKLCAQGICTIPSCNDGILDGNETDIDCGGGFCPPCQAGRTCDLALDCRSNVCLAMKCTEPGFTGTAYGGARGPVWLVAADFNNDRKLDVATANFTSNNASSLLGRGDGSFASLGSFSAGVSPVFVAPGDLNGDQRPDLVVVNTLSYDVSVLLGYGDGAFAPSVHYGVGAAPTSATIADVNGDKRPDIVVTNRASNSVSVLLGRGDGTFKDRVDFATDIDPRSLVAADLDGDGLNDLAVACRNSNRLSVLLNASKAGVVAFGQRRSTPTQVGPGAIVAADVNGDKKVDLIVGGFGAGGQIFLGGGNGSFQLAGPVGQGANFAQLALVDMNGDAILDLLTPAGVLLGTGNAGYQPLLAIPDNPSPPSFAVGDFNGDRLLDFAYPSQFEGVIVVLFGHGDGTFARLDRMNNKGGAVTDIALLSPSFVALSDLDGDGRSDLLTTSTSSRSLWVQMANANGSLRLPSVYPVGAEPRGLAVGDINEDQYPDVVVANSADAPTVLLGGRKGSLTVVVPVMGMPAPLAAPSSTQVAAGDVNRDHHLDLVFSGPQQGVVLLGAGDGTFSNNKAPAKIDGVASARQLQLLDFDGDGYLDLLAADGNSAVIALNQAPGRNRQWQGFHSATSVPMQGVRVAGAWLQDLDGDGQPDLVAADYATAAVRVLRNTHPGMGMIAFDRPLAYSVASHPSGLVMADFNRDGAPDIATCNQLDRSVSILLGSKGKLAFGDLVNHDVGVGPVFITSGDVNGDGWVDLATADEGAGTTTILINTH